MENDTLSLESFATARSQENTETLIEISETLSDVTETSSFSQITSNSTVPLIQAHLNDQNPLLYKHLSQHGMITEDNNDNISSEIEVHQSSPRDKIPSDNISLKSYKFKNLEKFILDKKMQFNYSPVYKARELTNLVEFTSIISQACHILCLLLPILIAYLVQPGTSSFSWHPFLMTTTYSFINLQAILVFSPERVKNSNNQSKNSVQSNRTNPMVVSDDLNSSQDSIPHLQKSNIK